MASFQFEVIEVSFPVCWTYFPCLAILFDLLSFSVQKWGVLYRPTYLVSEHFNNLVADGRSSTSL